MTTTQSEIRPSQINQLKERVESLNYERYLRRVRLIKVRGFRDQVVGFDFPVTALVGPNGGGKTTILGAAALAYKAVKPRRFFAKSGRFDGSMRAWRIEWDILDRNLDSYHLIRRGASFPQSKWYRDALDRTLEVFGVSRTVPANEQTALQKCVSNQFTVPQGRIARLDGRVAGAVQQILAKNVTEFNHVKVDDRGRVSLLTGVTGTGEAHSEFHFGAGESSVIRMVMAIEEMPNQSLILIEEIENGLHPVATARMVEYLIEVAERKRVQTIFTTHSNDALWPLPPEAIWASIRWEVFRGKLDVHALRTIEGTVTAQAAIFTEDEFAASWVRAMLRADPNIDLDAVQVYALTGDGMAVALSKFHNQDPSVQFPAISVIDGDSRQEDNGRDIIRLPGQNPERLVYDRVLDRIDEDKGVLAVALHRRFEDQDLVAEVVRRVGQTNRDPHLLYSQVGRQLGLIPESTVRDGFVSVWVQANPSDVERVVGPIRAGLPD